MDGRKSPCSHCTKDTGKNFCPICGRDIRCSNCKAFLQPLYNFCDNCRNPVKKHSEPPKRNVYKSDRSVVISKGGIIGALSTGDDHEGSMTSVVYPGRTPAKRYSSNKLPDDIFRKSRGNRSVYVAEGAVLGAVSTGDNHEGDMTSYVIDQGPGGDGSEPKEHKGFLWRESSRSNLLKSTDDSADIEFLEKIVELAKSVGCIWSPVCTGTAFRMGANLIMTCWHVIKDILDKMKVLINDTRVWVQFNYKPGDENYPNNQRFLFASIVYSNEDLDVAVVQLDMSCGNPLPPPITKFGPAAEGDRIQLVGHNQGWSKKLDPDCLVRNPQPNEVDRCQRELELMFSHHGNFYQGIHVGSRIRFHCGFEKGASGSPGVVNRHDGLHVATMLSKGYPGFYYDLKESERKDIIKQLGINYFIEEGIDMMAILEDIKTKGPDVLCAVGLENLI